LRLITLDRLEALLRDDGREEEQGIEQPQQNPAPKEGAIYG